VNNTLETLLQELEKSTLKAKQLEELNQDYKNVMGDQQVKIVNLEAQLRAGKDPHHPRGSHQLHETQAELLWGAPQTFRETQRGAPPRSLTIKPAAGE
jgi:hypothetical protein